MLSDKRIKRYLSYVEEFLARYDDLSRGVPIEGIAETIAFLNIIEHIKKTNIK